MARPPGGRPALNGRPGAAAEAFIGIDLGTSGCRGVAIDHSGSVIARAALPLEHPHRAAPGGSEQDPGLWWVAVRGVARAIGADLATTGHRPVAIAVDGTSSTLLLCDAQGRPRAPAMMYDDSRGRESLPEIAQAAPPDSAVHSATSSLAKALRIRRRIGFRPGDRLLHQGDWVTGRLAGRFDLGDENNALKLGYDPVERRWPAWLERLGLAPGLLPSVFPAGSPVGRVGPAVAVELALPEGVIVVAGTTDSTAAVLASGVSAPGEACTVLGSTLVLKTLSDRPVFDAETGVYSHRVGDAWIAGGASNSGCAVLDAFFSLEEIEALSARVQSDRPTGVACYPLLRPGERFPVNDPGLAPLLPPRDLPRHLFLQVLMEGVAEIERRGYRRLSALGACTPRSVTTLGGGARNAAWQRIRERVLGVPVRATAEREAAFGTALLARRALP